MARFDTPRLPFCASACLALAFALSACTPGAMGEVETVTLSDTTLKLGAKQQRNQQLQTGITTDDIPEYTGAPSAHGRWPAPTATGKTVYRDVRNMEVGAEGPGAVTSAAHD